MKWFISPKELRRRGVVGMNQRNAWFIAELNPRRNYPLVDDKLVTKKLALDAGIAVPELCGVIETNHDIRNLARIVGKHDDFVIKPAHGSGGNGIMVGWRSKGELGDGSDNESFFLSADWANAEDVPTGNEIAHNEIHTCGAVNHGCVGIFDAFSAETRIAHNVMYAMPYTGISVGFRWDESPTSQRDTVIEYNHVYDTMRMLADGGCLYTLGWQPGTVIRGNVFHDVHRSEFAHGGAPNNGIFFDQGSKGYHVVGNTIYDSDGGPIRFNQTSPANMTWENNSFNVGPGYRVEP